jgi:hypothetical protein
MFQMPFHGSLTTNKPETGTAHSHNRIESDIPIDRAVSLRRPAVAAPASPKIAGWQLKSSRSGDSGPHDLTVLLPISPSGSASSAESARPLIRETRQPPNPAAGPTQLQSAQARSSRASAPPRRLSRRPGILVAGTAVHGVHLRVSAVPILLDGSSGPCTRARVGPPSEFRSRRTCETVHDSAARARPHARLSRQSELNKGLKEWEGDRSEEGGLHPGQQRDNLKLSN